MSNLQWTERAGEGVTAQHKASVGKLHSRKHQKSSGRNVTFKLKPMELEIIEKIQTLWKVFLFNMQSKADLRISLSCVCLYVLGVDDGASTDSSVLIVFMWKPRN